MRIYNGLPPPKVQQRAGRVQRKMAGEGENRYGNLYRNLTEI
jgi:hypothetical protein